MAKRATKALPTPINTPDRALPVISVYRQHDKIEQVLGLMREHDHGVFMRSASWVDETMTDDRIYGVSSTRIGAILSAPMKFIPADDSALAKQIAEEIGGTGDNGRRGLWDEMFPTSAAADTLKWGQHLGFAFGKFAWQKTVDKWTPRLVPWHPSSVRWDWQSRRFIAQTENGKQVVLPRPDEQPRGDGQWLVYCPYGVEYGWRSGLIRSLAFKYLSRQWTERDHDRLNERQGMGILKANVPPNSLPHQRDEFFRQLQNIGNEAVAMTTKAADGTGFDVDKVEFVARTWESMNTRREALNSDIAIAVLGQNLTTEVKAGSRAAAMVHEVLRIDKALQDAKIGMQLRTQMLSWYCEYNYGDPDLAPMPMYEVEPPADDQGEATALKLLGEAGNLLKIANPRTDIEAIWEANGIPQISEEEFAAQEEEKAAKAAEAAAEAAKNAPPEGEGGDGGGGDGGGDGGPPKGGGFPFGKKKEPGALSAVEVKKRYEFGGLPIAIENVAGSIRLWADADGKETGSTKMLCDYGFIEGHLSGDDEELDCYVGSFEGASEVYVVHQLKAPDYRGHDEDKVFLGFYSAEEAKACYLAHRDDERAFGSMSVIPLERFKVTLNRRGHGSTRKIRASAIGGARLATARALVALASKGAGAKRTSAGQARAAKYQDALTKRAIEAGARALAPSLEHLFEHVSKASSLAEFRKKLPGLQHGMDLKGLATVIQQTNILSKLAGMDAARKET